MSTDKTLAGVQPGGRVRLGDGPKDGEVLVEVSGLTGSGKSAIAGEIEILCKTLGLEVEWVNGDDEKRLTHADWIGALEMYKPKVVILERNVSRAALSAQPSPGGQDARRNAAYDAIDRFLRANMDDVAYAVHEEHLETLFVAARQPVEVSEGEFRAAASRQTASAESNATAEALIAAARQPVDADRAEKALRDACEYVGQRSDGDLSTLAERCELWMRESRVLIDSQKQIAARQPVGELVAWRVTPEMRAAFRKAYREGGFWHDRLDTALDAMMRAARPAQAVDLGQFREPIAAWSKHCAHSVKGYESYQDSDLPDWMAERRQQVRKCGELLALIDSHTAGGQP